MKFKVGDQVNVVPGSSSFITDLIGIIGTIVAITPDYSFPLEIDFGTDRVLLFEEYEVELAVPHINEQKLKKALGL